MDQFLTHVPNWLTTIGIVVPSVVVGALAVIGITDKKARERTKEREQESDALQEKIKKLYQEEAKAQDDKIQAQNTEIKVMGERLATLEAENRMFRSLVSGTDEKTLAYKARVESTLVLVDKLAQIIILNGEKADKILEESLSINKNVLLLAKAIQQQK